MSLREAIIGQIREHGPLSFARYMELALYHPKLGYYARADRRSGRSGDFFTSADVGSLFGELLVEQFVEMWQVLQSRRRSDPCPFDLVEAGAGNGRLARAMLDAAAARYPDFYAAIQLTLVERSPAARDAQTATLGRHASKLQGSIENLPTGVYGVIFANELLDALPVNVIVMTDSGLREVYIDAHGDRLLERLGPTSSHVQKHVEQERIQLKPGWRAEVCPAAAAWVSQVASALQRGFIILVDYGHEAADLYSPTHPTGTLATYHRHQVRNGTDDHWSGPPWLADPGTVDITAHVDLTAARRAAERAGLRTLAVLDQMYFLLGLSTPEQPAAGLGLSSDHPGAEPRHDLDTVKRRLAWKTLMVPGGLGSTHKVIIFGKGVGKPKLRGCSFRVRAT